jgi:hypothetical protein
MPMFETAGIHTFFNGPESFTPDDRYYLGEAPEIAATGSPPGTTPSASCPRAARAWRWRNGSNDGEPPFDLWEVDIRRAQPFQRNRRYLKERVTETLGLLYADHFPYRQVATARGVRRSPGARAPERPRRGVRRRSPAGSGPTGSRPRSGAGIPLFLEAAELVRETRAEHMAVREGVGLFDMTSFGKIRVEGRDAAFLQAALRQRNGRAEPGRIVYTQMLNAAAASSAT